MKATGPSRLLDLPWLASEFGPSYSFWYAVIVQHREIPVIRPGPRRRLLVQRRDVEQWLTSHTDRGDVNGS